MQVSAADALLRMLHPAWQALIGGCLLAVTLLGIRRLAARGPTRVANALFFTGFLIVGVIVLGVLMVSCSQPQNRLPSTDMRTRTP